MTVHEAKQWMGIAMGWTMLLFLGNAALANPTPSDQPFFQKSKQALAEKNVQLKAVPPFSQIKAGPRQSGLPTRSSDAVALNQDPTFSLPTHSWITKNLECSDEINKGHYNQDIIMQPVAKAHFDNCEFKSGLDFIQELMTKAKKTSDQLEHKRALSYLGMAIHALQDFYAHSNYVELMEQKFPNDFSKVRPLKLWTDAGRQEVLRLSRLEGEKYKLVSGYVFWGFPQNKCPRWVKSHADMAKDSHSMTNGLKEVESWEKSRFQAARALAAQETRLFLQDTLGTWENLQETCGDAVTFLTILDQRVVQKEQNEK